MDHSKTTKAVPTPQAWDGEKDRQPNWARQKERLLELASRAGELSEKLGPSGKPLSSDEQELIRLANLGLVTEVMREARLRYLVGDDLGTILLDLANVLRTEVG